MQAFDTSEPRPGGLTNEETLVLLATPAEFTFLRRAIHVSLDSIDEWEYETRLGLYPDEARRVDQRLDEATRAPHDAEPSLAATETEVAFLANSIVESFEFVDLNTYEERFGITRESARELRDVLREIYSSTARPQ